MNAKQKVKQPCSFTFIDLSFRKQLKHSIKTLTNHETVINEEHNSLLFSVTSNNAYL